MYRYQVGGSLTKEDSNYIERDADDQIYQALVTGDFCYVFSSRQMGKSSLLVRTKYRLELDNISCAAIDLTGIGSDNITKLQWYRGIITQLYLGFDLIGKLNFKQWWQEQEDIAPLQKLNNFLQDVLFVYFPERKIVIFVDEIDSVFSLPFATDDFFAFIRFCYNQRAIALEYKRLSFAIFGVANPSNLIQDKQRTPFNIGRSIKLTGFTIEKALPLTKGFNLPPETSKAIMKDILFWTGGQPFLTQKLCQLVVEYLSKHNEDICIEKIIREKIINCWEFQDEPEHLRTITNRLLRDRLSVIKLLETYQTIIIRGNIPYHSDQEQIELFLSGIVIEQEGYLVIKNIIYQQIFNLNWVKQKLGNLRPYATQLQSWIDLNKPDSLLLDRHSLQQALVWSKNKKLADIDYQFISASQTSIQNQTEQQLNSEQAARKNIEIALQASRKAIALLASVKQTIKRQNHAFRLPKSWLVIIFLLVSFLTNGFRATGYLQVLEFWAYDRSIQNNFNKAINSEITIIKIEETDIQNFAQYPISDRLLSQAIKRLIDNQASVIGLDIYRDLPVAPGTEELEEIFQLNHNIYGIEKVLNGRVNPPPILSDLGQVGFNDLVLDKDSKIRRALLSYSIEQNQIKYSFALQIALKYLAQKNISVEILANLDSQVKLGKAIFKPFKSNDGSYINAKSKGYQILLNYQYQNTNFNSYSLSQLLADKIPPNLIKDRIVLIGVTADSINDVYLTPDRPTKFMAGIFIHANIINSILEAAATGNTLIKVLPELIEWLYISLWIFIGTILVWSIKSWQKLTIAILLTIAIAILIADYLFISQWWIPLIPPIIGLLITIIATKLITQYQKSRLQLQQTEELLVTISKEQPAVGKIALEYFKQSEKCHK